MTIFHDRPSWLAGPIVAQSYFASVKGVPDVVRQRCSHTLWHGELSPAANVREKILAANR
jgi:magnesium-transporting ATPase (P-type)